MRQATQGNTTSDFRDHLRTQGDSLRRSVRIVVAWVRRRSFAGDRLARRKTSLWSQLPRNLCFLPDGGIVQGEGAWVQRGYD